MVSGFTRLQHVLNVHLRALGSLFIAIFALTLFSVTGSWADEEFTWDTGGLSQAELEAWFGGKADEIDYDEARSYMLELVNRDRQAIGLIPLVLDDFATKVAQWQAHDMAVRRYISHWNTDGFTPTMRYTTGGGNDGVTENITYFQCSGKVYLTRKVVEYMQERFMNSEGHRRNVLSPEHNKLGVGIGFAEFPGVGMVFTCDQTFVADYGGFSGLPHSILLGDELTIEGTLDIARVEFRYISLAWAEFPQEMSPDVLKANLQGGENPGSYNIHAPIGSELFSSFVPVAEDVSWDLQTGKYSLTVDLSNPLEGTPMPPDGGGAGTQGIYYIFVWATLKPSLIPEDFEGMDDYSFMVGVWTLGALN